MQEAKPAPIAAELGTQGAGSRDHLLLVVTVVIHGTPVRALVDSGASRSFVSDELKLRPPLHFVGAYSSLELANGETIVSTGMAPQVLVSIGDVQCRVNLTAIPLMDGISVILGKDWLDTLNPLIDWRSNTVYLRLGDKLQKVQGQSSSNVQPSGIKDKGLSGLRDSFVLLREGASTNLSFGKWGDLYSRLASPQFWEYCATSAEWTSTKSGSKAMNSATAPPVAVGSAGSPSHPQGEVELSTTPTEDTQKSFSQAKTRNIKVAGRCVRQPKREKIDFMTFRQAARLANNTEQPMFLGMIRATESQKPEKKMQKQVQVQGRSNAWDDRRREAPVIERDWPRQRGSSCD